MFRSAQHDSAKGIYVVGNLSFLHRLGIWDLKPIWNLKFGIFQSEFAARHRHFALAFLPRPRQCRYNRSLFSWHAARDQQTSLGTCSARPWRDRILPMTSYIRIALAGASIARS